MNQSFIIIIFDCFYGILDFILLAYIVVHRLDVLYVWAAYKYFLIYKLTTDLYSIAALIFLIAFMICCVCCEDQY